MPRADYTPQMNWEVGIGDEAGSLAMLLHKHRKSSRPPIRFREPQEPMTHEQREHLLRRHCSRKGKKHEFLLETRAGTVCVWCGIPRKEMN